MIQVIRTEQKPIKLWLQNIEPGALSQARNLANLPFVFRHIAIMPDAHQGYGMPIGAVMATRGVVVPNAVGVDIGCGMCAVRTSLTGLDKKSLQMILGGSKTMKGGIRGKIPLGFSHRSSRQEDWLTEERKNELSGWSVIEREYDSSLKQIGTLGGGNHFIEIQQGDDGFIWLMIHSGSRNIGFKVAKRYNELAVSLRGKMPFSVPKQWQLAALPLESDAGRNYMLEMQCCVDFALANRRLMMDHVKASVSEVAGPVEYSEMINVSHNFAAMETHFGQKVMVHRKGATRAFAGQTGIIPGSQGSASYVVRGKGEPESFMSCSHGAGRKMGRKEARRKLDLASEKSKLDKLGIIHAIRSRKDLDEAPGSYKNISEVIGNQRDLVDIAVKLRPLAVIKG